MYDIVFLLRDPHAKVVTHDARVGVLVRGQYHTGLQDRDAGRFKGYIEFTLPGGLEHRSRGGKGGRRTVREDENAVYAAQAEALDQS